MGGGEALLGMDGDLKGDYFPLHGSRSYEPKPSGMDHETEERLRCACSGGMCRASIELVRVVIQ